MFHKIPGRLAFNLTGLVARSVLEEGYAVCGVDNSDSIVTLATDR